MLLLLKKRRMGLEMMRMPKAGTPGQKVVSSVRVFGSIL